LVDKDDRRRPPDRDLLPERTDAAPERGVARLVARARHLEEVREAMPGGDERVVSRRDRRVGRQDLGGHEPAPEQLAKPALEVMTCLDADRRRVQPDEQEPVTQWWQVGQGLD